MILYPLSSPLIDELEGGSQDKSKTSDDEAVHLSDEGPSLGTVKKHTVYNMYFLMQIKHSLSKDHLIYAFNTIFMSCDGNRISLWSCSNAVEGLDKNSVVGERLESTQNNRML